jgi:hypothetical protein
VAKTPGAGTKVAAQKVFNVVELLEDILVRTDFLTLLRLQRVSRAFYDTITGSIKLQKKLYFQPATVQEAGELGMLNIGALVLVDAKESGNVQLVWNHHLMDPQKKSFTMPPELLEQASGSWVRMHVCHPALSSIGYRALYPAPARSCLFGKFTSSTNEQLAGRIVEAAKQASDQDTIMMISLDSQLKGVARMTIKDKQARKARKVRKAR